LAVGQGLVGALLLGAAACEPLADEDYDSANYAGTQNWLCRPDKADNLCRTSDQGTTVVKADGTNWVEQWRPTSLPLVDCFYVYGTVSQDPGLNADFNPLEEPGVVELQAARFGSACRVFVPLYRQVTATALTNGTAGDPRAFAVAYGDVLDSFREYLAHHNHGRGFVLIGHSQGQVMLNALLKREIEPDPQLRSRLVSAYLAGAAMQVQPGTDTGSDFTTPVCSRFAQTGCLVPWGTYRSTIPPGPLGLYGRDDLAHGLEAACVNPAALADPLAGPDDKRWATPYFGTGDGPVSGDPWVDRAFGTVSTPFVKTPRFVETECVSRPGYHYLEATIHGDPADPRVDDIGGDFVVPDRVTPDMGGLHLQDINIVLGDLIRLTWIQGLSWALTH
jgi:hypothetical protein